MDVEGFIAYDITVLKLMSDQLSAYSNQLVSAPIAYHNVVKRITKYFTLKSAADRSAAADICQPGLTDLFVTHPKLAGASCQLSTVCC